MKHIWIIGLLFILASCGQQIPPTGGPRDSIPPKLVLATPEFNAKGFKGNKIVLEFDEYINLDNPFEKLTFSPTPKVNPIAEGRLKTVSIRIKDTLEENTTYSIDFGEAIRDINENNVLKGFHYSFSTGTYIDSATLTGKVWIAESGKTDSTLIAVLHRNPDDSAVAKEKPRYYSRLQGDGSFLFRNLKPGVYHVFAIKDADGGKKYDQASELIAFLDSPITVGKDTSVTLYAFEEEREIKPLPKLNKPATAKKPEDMRLRLLNNLENTKQDLLGDLILSTEHPFKKADTSMMMLGDKTFNRIPGYQITKDSIGKQLIIKNKWVEGASYNLILQKEFATDTLGNKFIKTDTIPFTAKKEADYGSLDIRVMQQDSIRHPMLVLSKDGKTYLKQHLLKERFQIRLFPPGEYNISILFDANMNGKWDTGNYWKKLQPERVVNRKQTLTIRANWDNELRLDLTEFN